MSFITNYSIFRCTLIMNADIWMQTKSQHCCLFALMLNRLIYLSMLACSHLLIIRKQKVQQKLEKSLFLQVFGKNQLLIWTWYELKSQRITKTTEIHPEENETFRVVAVETFRQKIKTGFMVVEEMVSKIWPLNVGLMLVVRGPNHICFRDNIFISPITSADWSCRLNLDTNHPLRELLMSPQQNM